MRTYVRGIMRMRDLRNVFLETKHKRKGRVESMEKKSESKELKQATIKESVRNKRIEEITELISSNDKLLDLTYRFVTNIGK